MVALSRVEAGGRTAAASALKRSFELLKRRGVILLFSDLYDDEEAMETELRRSLRMGHEVSVFHVLTPEEMAFGVEGEVEVEDLESGERVLSGGVDGRSVYAARLAEFLGRWQARCTRYGIDYSRVITDTPLDEALRGFLLRRRAAGSAR